MSGDRPHRRVAAALAVAFMISACAGKPIGGPSSGPLLGGASGDAPAPSSSPAPPPPPPTWKLATLPPTTPTSILRDVVVTDPTHAWAVGSDVYTPPELYTTGEPLMLQWDGSRWSRVQLPGDITWKGGGLRHVAADSPTNVWVVGGPASHDINDNVTRILRFDGSSWREVPFPAGNTPSTMSITDLAVVDGHAWLVGRKGTPAVILEWDGQTWREHEPPGECVRGGTSFGGMPNFCNIIGIKAFAPNDIWACGNGAWNGFLGPLLFHWNGSAWRVVKVGLNEQRLALEAIGGRSSSDLWAVGTTIMEGGGPLAVHGDGTTWQVVGGLPTARLPDVEVDAAGQPWLIENYSAPSATLATYRGAGPRPSPTSSTAPASPSAAAGTWADTPAPMPEDAVGMSLNGIAAVPGSNMMFAVGAADLPTDPRRLRAVILEYSSTR